ncbi:MAG: hypothetical protein ABGX83_02535 [Nitrospira sp.]|nr:hypothetical protein [Candidatus Manganitrophaceae bacterium]HIL35214.1 hypothetical protein [Candidatus Manganitrophaceae bacterium]
MFSKYSLIFLLTVLFACTLGTLPSLSSSQNEAVSETGSKNKADAGRTLIGSVHLDPSANAKTYKVKIKESGQVLHEARLSAGEPFRFNSIVPGLYELVIEANGHTTFVEPDFIRIGSQDVTRVTVQMKKALTLFLKGDATRTIMCSACHKKIYMELLRGEGSDLHTSTWPGPDGTLIDFPDDLSHEFYPDSSPVHLAYVSPITVAAIARQPKKKRDACRRCHAPTGILQGGDRPTTPDLREKNREDGVSCASCHLDRDGNVHGKYDVSSPHPTIQDPLFTPARSAEICAVCHQSDEMAPEHQTFLEWKRDFATGGDRTCRDCHMPPDVRLLSEIFSDRPKRAIGKHLFLGGHSVSMLKKAATLLVKQDGFDPKVIHVEITNDGAGHSFPTGYGPRAILLYVDISGPDTKVRADLSQEVPVAIYTVDPGLFQGLEAVHPAIRARATEKVSLKLGSKAGVYKIKARLFYDLDGLDDFNDKSLPLIASVEVQLKLGE